MVYGPRSDGATITPSDPNRYYNKMSVILDGLYSYEISQFDLRGDDDFRVKSPLSVKVTCPRCCA